MNASTSGLSGGTAPTLTNLTVDTTNSVYSYLDHSGGMGELESMDFRSNECSQVVIYYTLSAGTPLAARSTVSHVSSAAGLPMSTQASV